jgi:hypothetical protein
LRARVHANSTNLNQWVAVACDRLNAEVITPTVTQIGQYSGHYKKKASDVKRCKICCNALQNCNKKYSKLKQCQMEFEQRRIFK